MFIKIFQSLLKQSTNRKHSYAEVVGKRYLQSMIEKGSRVLVHRKIASRDVESFSQLTGDFNSVHFGEEAIAHGLLLNGFVGAILGTKLPGPGYVVCEQSMTFPNPCRVGDDIEIVVEILEVRKIVVCKYVCTSVSKNYVVHQGTAKLMKFKGLK